MKVSTATKQPTQVPVKCPRKYVTYEFLKHFGELKSAHVRGKRKEKNSKFVILFRAKFTGTFRIKI